MRSEQLTVEEQVSYLASINIRLDLSLEKLSECGRGLIKDPRVKIQSAIDLLKVLLDLFGNALDKIDPTISTRALVEKFSKVTPINKRNADQKMLLDSWIRTPIKGKGHRILDKPCHELGKDLLRVLNQLQDSVLDQSVRISTSGLPDIPPDYGPAGVDSFIWGKMPYRVGPRQLKFIKMLWDACATLDENSYKPRESGNILNSKELAKKLGIATDTIRQYFKRANDFFFEKKIPVRVVKHHGNHGDLGLQFLA